MFRFSPLTKRLYISERGLTIFEALVALALTSIVLLTHAQSIIQSQRTYRINVRNSLAMQQAESLMEQYSVKNMSTLSASNNLTNNNYLYNGMRFNQTVTVTVNADGTKTVVVTVTPVKTGQGGSITLTERFTVLKD